MLPFVFSHSPLVIFHRQPLSTNEIVAREMQVVGSNAKQSDSELTFQIVHIEDVITLRASDKRSKRLWMEKIKSATSKALEMELTLNPTLSSILCYEFVKPICNCM